jgi:hypothetical protein
MKLYEIADQFRKLDEFVPDIDSQADGEAYTDLFNDLIVSFSDKVHNTCCVMRNTEADIVAIDQEIKRLQARKKALVGKVTSLEEYLTYCLKNAEVNEVKTSLFNVKFVKSPPSVVGDNIESLPEEYTRVKREADKTAIKDALQKGVEIPGWSIESKITLRVK